MADGKDSGSNLPTSGIVLLLVMATGTIFFARDLPLQGSRPPSAERQTHDTYASKSVEARLWQDPLAAVRNAWAEERKGELPEATSNPVCTSSHRSHRCPVADRLKGGRVIGVTVPGAPYAEDAESRRRYRYAVLAALNVQKYVPADGEHIDYFVPRQTDGVLPETIPFEQFDPDERSPTHPKITIIWIDEDTLTRGRAPIASLISLYRQLKPPTEQPASEADIDRPPDPVTNSGSTQAPDRSASSTKASFTIIGPSSSVMLSAMIEEHSEPARRCADRKPPAACSIEFFDYGATVSDTAAASKARSVKEDSPAPEGKAQPIEDYFHKRGFVFHRMVAPDNILAMALADELRLRNICLIETDCSGWRQSRGHVALVSEWDTFYGQSLRGTISRALCPPNLASGCSSKFENYSYLRGLDGQLPNDGASSEVKPPEAEQPSREQANKKKDDDTSSDTAKRLGRPDGLGQFDYLRRLAASMKRRHQELRRHGEGGITAIGVLGSDVYDKLLLLRALRPEFPEALFFTTDLDARFSDQGEIAATRNLLVVSAFDLQLQQEFQRDIPPFRDGYQTAVFLSTQAAVRGGNVGCETCGTPSWTKAARIFQIGRSGAFAFPTDRKTTSADPGGQVCSENPLRCSNIHAPSFLYPKMFSDWSAKAGAAFLMGLALVGVSLGCMALVGGFDQPTIPADRTQISRPMRRRVVAVAAFVAGAALGAYWNDIAEWLTGHGTGEPMLLSEGISIWPVIAVRTLTFAVCLVLIAYSLNRLDANIDAIAAELRLDDRRRNIIAEQLEADRHRPLWARLRDVFASRLPERPPHGREMDEPYEIVKFWRTYVYRGRKRARVLRVAVCIGFMFMFGWVLTIVFGPPNDPARDTSTHIVYQVITAFDVFATQFLMFLVADATVSSCRFVRELRKVRSVWPERSRKAFRALLGVYGAPIDDWIDTKFVAMRTQCIINLIYLPFIMIALLIVSRSSAFDSFAASPTLILMHGLSLAVLGGCVLWLRWEAEQARTIAQSNLTSALITMKSDERTLKGAGRRQPAGELEKLISRVETLQEGSFALITRQPVVRALLLPLGTYGGTALLEHFSLGGF